MSTSTKTNNSVGLDTIIDPTEKSLPANMSNEQVKSLMELEDVLQENSYDDEIGRVNKDIAELDMLYSKLSVHTLNLINIQDSGEQDSGKPARMGTNAAKPVKRPSPVYVASQISNMISLKNLTLSYLKQKVDLKDSRLDRATKIISQIKKAGGDGEGISEAEIFKFLLKLNSENKTKKSVSQSEGTVIEHEDDVDLDFDAIMDQRLLGVDEIPTNADINTAAEHIKNAETAIVENDIEEEEDVNKDIPLDKIPMRDDYKFYLEMDEEENITGCYLIDSEYNVVKEIDDVDILDLTLDEETDVITSGTYPKLEVEIAE